MESFRLFLLAIESWLQRLGRFSHPGEVQKEKTKTVERDTCILTAKNVYGLNISQLYLHDTAAHPRLPTMWLMMN